MGNPSGVLRVVRGLSRRGPADPSELVCHCKRVRYTTVEKAIRRGARSVADLQRQTTACTRCFGCRFELEGLLKAHLGEDYHGEARITLPPDYERLETPQPMYMPVLAGFGDSPVDTRLVVFNWEGPREPVDFRVDLMRLNAERVAAWHRSVASGSSAVVELSRAAVSSLLPEGVGVVKMVLDRVEVGSLRPYFHFSTPTTVTSTHEKKGARYPHKLSDRRYNWLFPIARSHRPEEVYLFFVNTQLETMTGQRLVWQSVDGDAAVIPLDPIGFEAAVFVPLHEHVPAVGTGTKVGTVRLEPAAFTVAGFMMRHDREAALWRVQHL